MYILYTSTPVSSVHTLLCNTTVQLCQLTNSKKYCNWIVSDPLELLIKQSYSYSKCSKLSPVVFTIHTGRQAFSPLVNGLIND